MIHVKDAVVLSVSELSRAIKNTLELQYRFVHVRGEVSNLHIPYSGHLYFTLKDNDAQIRAVLFKGQRQYLAEEIKEGKSIVCHGRISVYEIRGEYQIIVDTVDFKGTGNLQLQFERLQKKLTEEGFFQPERKKKAPPYPEKIYVVTSPTGAAVHDFIKIAEQRGYWGKITIVPVLVQGRNAAKQIVDAIFSIHQIAEVDLIVLIRGGGTLEDLWAFNEEIVARSIFSSTIPIVTGIGHETDVTIADLCADLHLHTPTAAAEAIIPDCKSLLENIESQRKFLYSYLVRYIYEREERIQQLKRIMGDLELFLTNRFLQLDYLFAALENKTRSKLAVTDSVIAKLEERLNRHSPIAQLSMKKQHVQHLHDRLIKITNFIIERKQAQMARQAALIDSVSPLSVLARGYAVVSTEKKIQGEMQIVSRSDQVEIGDFVNVLLHKGRLLCRIKDKRS